MILQINVIFDGEIMPLMNSYIIALFFLLQTFAVFCQQPNESKGLRPSMASIEESIEYTIFSDSMLQNNTFRLPEKSNAVLLYKYADKNSTDNYDSLTEVIKTIYLGRNKPQGHHTITGLYPGTFLFYAIVKRVDKHSKALFDKITAQKDKIVDSLVRKNSFQKLCDIKIILVTDSLLKTSVLHVGKVNIIHPNGTFNSSLSVLKFAEGRGINQKLIKGMLLTEVRGKKMPLVNAKVFLYRNGRTSIDSALTDKWGLFELLTSSQINEYNFEAQPASKSVHSIILATQTGQELMKLRKAERNFEYKLIHADIIKLQEMKEKDISLVPFISKERTKKN
jgi:hypothetical protein